MAPMRPAPTSAILWTAAMGPLNRSVAAQLAPAVAQLAHADQLDAELGDDRLDLAGAEERVFVGAVAGELRLHGFVVARRIEMEGEEVQALGRAAQDVAIDALGVGGAIPGRLVEEIEHRLAACRRVGRER